MPLLWQQLAIPETNRTGFTHKLVLDYTDLTGFTSGTAFAIYPQPNGAATTPAGTLAGPMAVYVNTGFTGAGPLTALTASVGDGSVATRYVNAQSLFTTDKWLPTGNPPSTSPSLGTGAADTIDLVLTATGGTLAALTAGRFTLFARFADLNTLL